MGRLPAWTRVATLAIALAAASAASPAAFGGPKEAAPPTISPEEAALLQQSLNRGTLMYAYDQAAWQGTDDLREKLPEAARSTVGGWIVDGPADNPHLVFIDKDEAEPHALYVADFKDGKLVASHILGTGEDRSLTPSRKAMVAALRTARKALADSGTKMCVPNPFNTIVLPGTQSAPTLVYFLTPQTTTKSLPFGGHYLVEVSADGRAGPVRAFMKTQCAELPLVDDKGKRPEALVMSDLLHQVPSEIHVFSSLSGRIPVYVMTALNKTLWAVEGRRARLLKRDR